MNNLIIFVGKPGNYKTYLASRLASKIGYQYIPSASFERYSKTTFEDLMGFREHRFEKIMNWLRNNEKLQINIILEGSIYLDEHKRREILELNWNSRTIIFCSNDDEDLRMERIRMKAADSNDYESQSAKDIIEKIIINKDNINKIEFSNIQNVFNFKNELFTLDCEIQICIDDFNLKLIYSSNTFDNSKIIKNLRDILQNVKKSPVSPYYIYRVSEHFNNLSAKYDTSTEWRMSKEILNSLLPKINPYNKRVLDIATGTGICGAHFVKNGYNVFGIDISESMLKIASKKISKVILSDVHSLPFIKSYFDVAVMRQCLHYLHTTIALSEAHRVLKKNGILIIAGAYWPNPETIEYWEEFKSITQPLRNKIITEPFLMKQLQISHFNIEKVFYSEIEIRNVHLSSIENTWKKPKEGWKDYLYNFTEKMKIISPEMYAEFDGKIFSYKQYWITIHAKKSI
jgi:ubiquinone/menaquinone biosynthesis C-methylase UbiE